MEMTETMKRLTDYRVGDVIDDNLLKQVQKIHETHSIDVIRMGNGKRYHQEKHKAKKLAERIEYYVTNNNKLYDDAMEHREINVKLNIDNKFLKRELSKLEKKVSYMHDHYKGIIESVAKRTKEV